MTTKHEKIIFLCIFFISLLFPKPNIILMFFMQQTLIIISELPLHVLRVDNLNVFIYTFHHLSNITWY